MIVKPYTMQISIGIFAVLMGCLVACLLNELTVEGIGNTVMDYLGLVFVSLWIILICWMGIYSIVAGLRTVVVDEFGVSCSVLFFKRSYYWEDITDFGISYCGQARGEGKTYYLYFSKRVQRTKDKYKKRLKGQMIKTFIYQKHYSDVTDELFPFCRKFARVEPFVAEDKFHFI